MSCDGSSRPQYESWHIVERTRDSTVLVTEFFEAWSPLHAGYFDSGTF